ncbi:MAG TPA: hypothetical protein ENH19_02590 [Actinobacteria bacterium]|nr:hypothetical protein [Actinomycetes bacterium]HEX21525.1 hypothetical protein [Actinomycetota bacterium]
MNSHYADTISLCPSCAAESPAYYEEKSDGIYLFIKCEQLDSIIKPLETYSKIIFKVTIRSAQRFGVNQPLRRIFISDILRYLNKQDDFTYGGTPFNRYIRLQGKPVKVCAWVNDVETVRLIDSHYVISDDTHTTLHRGMKIDEILIASSITNSTVPINTLA